MNEWVFQWFDRAIGGFLGQGRPQGIPIESFFTLKQVHGAEVVQLKSPDHKLQGDRSGDAVVCSLPNIYIAVQTADCVPILWAHPAGVVAAVHAGWKGSCSEVLTKSFEALKSQWGYSPEEVQVAIGPAISKEVYEVGPEVAEPFQIKYPSCIKPFGKKYLLDLKEVNRLQALGLGIPETSIKVFSQCTYSDRQFFSHRRAINEGLSQTGRNYSYICLRT